MFGFRRPARFSCASSVAASDRAAGNAAATAEPLMKSLRLSPSVDDSVCRFDPLIGCDCIARRKWYGPQELTDIVQTHFTRLWNTEVKNDQQQTHSEGRAN